MSANTGVHPFGVVSGNPRGDRGITVPDQGARTISNPESHCTIWWMGAESLVAIVQANSHVAALGFRSLSGVTLGC